jgi:anti-anti-sigma regulatory factor
VSTACDRSGTPGAKQSSLDLHVTTQQGAEGLTVRVAGRLAADGAAELQHACSGAPRLRLDLSELVSADDEGTRLLARMRDAGAVLVGTPPFIELLLHARSGRAS